MTQIKDARAWLTCARPQQHAMPESKRGTSQGPPVTSTRRPTEHIPNGMTDTMLRAGEYQNMLTAVMYPHQKTGYKDPKDACNRSDKRNGGDYRRYESSYSKQFCSIDDKPIQFRRDGLPISARRIPGKPLMAPKLPNPVDLTIAKRMTVKYHHQSQVCIGNPHSKDPRRFNSVYQIVHAAPYRALAQPNPGIAAEDAARAHKELGLFS